jgi:hypothetical protein
MGVGGEVSGLGVLGKSSEELSLNPLRQGNGRFDEERASRCSAPHPRPLSPLGVEGNGTPDLRGKGRVTAAMEMSEPSRVHGVLGMHHEVRDVIESEL